MLGSLSFISFASTFASFDQPSGDLFFLIHFIHTILCFLKARLPKLGYDCSSRSKQNKTHTSGCISEYNVCSPPTTNLHKFSTTASQIFNDCLLFVCLFFFEQKHWKMSDSVAAVCRDCYC